MASNKYSMAFTTGGLLCNESEKVAQLYLELKSWPLVREQALATGLMQTRMQSSAARIYREISSRLQTLTQEELELFVNSTGSQRLHLLWLAVCSRYLFIREFSVEVLHERFLTLRHALTPEDFDAFFNAKAEWDHALDAITPNTRNKLRQNLFRMLRDAEYLSSNNQIQPAVLSPHLADLISLRGPGALSIFPTFQSEPNRGTR